MKPLKKASQLSEVFLSPKLRSPLWVLGAHSSEEGTRIFAIVKDRNDAEMLREELELAYIGTSLASMFIAPAPLMSSIEEYRSQMDDATREAFDSRVRRGQRLLNRIYSSGEGDRSKDFDGLP